eukprot:TRINITY_DN9992_c0_g1_i1.p1 TRINITY_DN9992_c0_g1~~TRINITY_DN9992_c0_g1_i1.p1  ORF type:complete len:390 (+),score=135.99 TRINITY_DN9992_c0_g1_i1:175-1344(+)
MSLEIHRGRRAPQRNATPTSPTGQVVASGASRGRGGGQVVLAQPQRAADQTKEFYIPGENELGLLEVFHRTRSLAQGGSADEGIPVCSRTVDELALNFYDFEGERVDLNNRLVLKGKMGMMQEQLTGVDDGAVISGREFKGLAGGLNGFVEAEYILVSYRDYSAWALRHYPSESTGSWLNPFSTLSAKRYVKKHFAIKLGSQPGVFLPITEAQFLVGCNKLHLRRSDASAAHSAYEALSQEQFNTICNIRHPEEFAQAHEAGAPPSSKDNIFGYVPSGNGLMDTVISYTPLGWYRRVRDDAYRALGQTLVSVVLCSAGAYILYAYLVRPFIGSSSNASQQQQDRRYTRTRTPRRSSQDEGGFGFDMMSASPLGFFKNRVQDGFDRILGA